MYTELVARSVQETHMDQPTEYTTYSSSGTVRIANQIGHMHINYYIVAQVGDFME
jgi:hypothetical protein